MMNPRELNALVRNELDHATRFFCFSHEFSDVGRKNYFRGAPMLDGPGGFSKLGTLALRLRGA